MKRPTGPGLLVEVLAELGNGHVYERFIHDDKAFVHGETEGKKITINPAVAIADTCLHEAIHACRPAWCENYVRRTTTWLLRQLSDEQIQRIYEVYQAKKRPLRKTP